jgi:hypothetical protein
MQVPRCRRTAAASGGLRFVGGATRGSVEVEGYGWDPLRIAMNKGLIPNDGYDLSVRSREENEHA